MKLFMTDYKSYNEGKQEVAGAWWDLSRYSDEDEFIKEVKKHISSIMGYNEDDVELMASDCENFPKGFYSESLEGIEFIFEYLTLCEYDQARFAWIVYNQGSLELASEGYNDVIMIECYQNWEIDYLKEFHNDVFQIWDTTSWVDINWDDLFFYRTEFEHNGVTYSVEN